MAIPTLLWIVATDYPRMQEVEIHDVCGVRLPWLSKLGR